VVLPDNEEDTAAGILVTGTTGRPMQVCVAQSRPVTGDIQRNIECHVRLVRLAVSNRAEVIIFPELSLTGYEPSLANQLATHENDSRFDLFQKLSDDHEITIGVGVPTQSIAGVCISVALFQPHKPRRLYSKTYLHPDEERFFVLGERFIGLLGKNDDIALAVCYELSVSEHAANAFASGARVYIASVAKPVGGIQQATERLAAIAREYKMTVLMANSVGLSECFQCAGKSAVWGRNGELLAQLDDANEGIIILDTLTLEPVVVYLAAECS
jgi:predicted amidohydrolase